MLLKIFARRKVTREHRLGDKLCRVKGPKLAHLRIRLQYAVGEFSILARDPANIDIKNRRPILVQTNRADGSMASANIVHRLEELSGIVAAAALECLLDEQKRRVWAGSIEALLT